MAGGTPGKSTDSLPYHPGSIVSDNRARGFKPMTLGEYIRAIKHQNRLIKQYPPAG